MDFRKTLSQGPIFNAAKSVVDVDSLFGKGKVIGLYFSASWCPPCRAFTPVLSEAYTKLKGEGKEVEIIFMSLDNEESAFEGYAAKMPFARCGYNDSRVKPMAGALGVQSIPTLAMIDGATGSLLTTEAADNLRAGKAFPWVSEAPDFAGLLAEAPVLDAKSNPIDTASLFGKGKLLGLYFSASWCPPCRAFTPVLIEKYEAAKKEGKDFEIVLFSWDEEASAYQAYADKMPWPRLPFEDKRIKPLGQQLKVRGIPTLAIIDTETGRVVSTSAADKMRSGASYPWC